MICLGRLVVPAAPVVSLVILCPFGEGPLSSVSSWSFLFLIICSFRLLFQPFVTNATKAFGL